MVTAPQLAAQPPRVHPGGLDAGGNHARSHRIIAQHGTHRLGVPFVERPRRTEPQHAHSVPDRTPVVLPATPGRRNDQGSESQSGPTGHDTVTCGAPSSPVDSISSAMRMASSISVSTILCSGTVLITSPLTKIWPLPLPEATPRSASRA